MNFINLRNANDILFVLSAAKTRNTIISKIALQKIIYLCGALQPIHDFTLSYLQFVYWHRGPYSKVLQNSVDHLAGNHFVEITDFKTLQGTASLADYKITDAGEQAVAEIIRYHPEEHRHWWICFVTRISIAYTNADFESLYSEQDKIVDIVYQEPSFKPLRESRKKYETIDFTQNASVSRLILEKFIRRAIANEPSAPSEKICRKIVELVTLGYMEYLYVKHLEEYGN